MRKNEIVKKNTSLVFDFLRYLIDHPEIIEKIPEGAEIEFLDKDFPLSEIHSGEVSEKVFLKVEHTFDIST